MVNIPSTLSQHTGTFSHMEILQVSYTGIGLRALKTWHILSVLERAGAAPDNNNGINQSMMILRRLDDGEASSSHIVNKKRLYCSTVTVSTGSIGQSDVVFSQSVTPTVFNRSFDPSIDRNKQVVRQRKREPS